MIMKRISVFILILLFFHNFAGAQSLVKLKGYVSSEDKRNYIDNATVTVRDSVKDETVAVTTTDEYGTFEVDLKPGGIYVINIRKDNFYDVSKTVDLTSPVNDKELFLKFKMKRKPGYIFEINLTEVKTEPGAPVKGIVDALVEVYDNNERKTVMSFRNKMPNFSIPLTKGKHYTILIRKKGYMAKQLEAYLNINGCIICFHGVSKMQPGVKASLNEDNTIGHYLADIEMQKVYKGKKFQVKNIYYDLNKAQIKPGAAKELNKLAKLLKLNPSLIVELGSHTDSRGSDEFNMRLSEKRAKAAVDYLVKIGGVDKNKIFYKGYGETQLVNGCKNGVPCTEKEHALNRRTEIKILDVLAGDDSEEFVPLSVLKDREKTDKKPDDIIRSHTMQDVEMPKDTQAVVGSIEPKTKDRGMVIDTVYDEKDLDIRANMADDSADDTNGGQYGKDISYKIVILFTRYPLPKGHALFVNNKGVQEWINEDGGYVLYLVGDYHNYDEAKRALDQRWIKRFPKAYIVKFKNGKKID